MWPGITLPCPQQQELHLLWLLGQGLGGCRGTLWLLLCLGWLHHCSTMAWVHKPGLQDDVFAVKGSLEGMGLAALLIMHASALVWPSA